MSFLFGTLNEKALSCSLVPLLKLCGIIFTHKHGDESLRDFILGLANSLDVHDNSILIDIAPKDPRTGRGQNGIM